MGLPVNERSWRHYLLHKSLRFGEISVEDVDAYIVIPAFAEGYPIKALESLKECAVGTFRVEVVLVLNIPKDANTEEKQLHVKTIRGIRNFREPSWMSLTVLDIGVVPKRGAGRPRKFGTDFVVNKTYKINNFNVPVLWLDADTMVSENYILEGIRALQRHDVIHFYFKHRTDGNSEFIKNRILKYESRLRYHRWAMRLSGIPWCPYYVGSCMGFTANAYVLSGGVSVSHQAGEDFYLMHKIIRQGNYGEVVEAVVYPEARVSLRVPYGTGPALAKQELEKYYSLESYEHVGSWLSELLMGRSLDYEKQPNWVQESVSRNRWLNWIRISKSRVDFIRNLCGLPLFKMIRRAGKLTYLTEQKACLEERLGLTLDEADRKYPLFFDGSLIAESFGLGG